MALVKHLLSNETSQALALINSVASEGLDLRPLHRTTVDCLRAVLLVKTGAKDSADLSTEAEKELTTLASQVPLEQIMRALRLFGQVNMKHDQPSPLPLELATVGLGLEPEPPTAPRPAPAPMAEAPAPIPPRPSTARAAPPERAERAAPPSPPSNPAPTQAPVASASNEPAQAPSQAPSGKPEERLATGWLAILRSMSGYKGRRFDIGALLRSSRSHYLDGSTLVVRFAHRSNVERLQDELKEPRCRLALEEQIKQILGDAYAIRVEAEENGAGSAQDQGHLVRTAINMGGHVVPEPEHPKEANE